MQLSQAPRGAQPRSTEPACRGLSLVTGTLGVGGRGERPQPCTPTSPSSVSKLVVTKHGPRAERNPHLHTMTLVAVSPPLCPWKAQRPPRVTPSMPHSTTSGSFRPLRLCAPPHPAGGMFSGDLLQPAPPSHTPLTARGRLVGAVPAVVVQIAGPGDGDAAATGTGELVGRAGPSCGQRWCECSWSCPLSRLPFPSLF